MKQNIFAVNGRFFDVMIMELEEGFQVLDNADNAGRLISGEMVRDIIGTYYNYKLKLEPRRRSMSDYRDLIDLVSAPIDHVSLTLNMGGRRMNFDAYVTNGASKFTYIREVERWAGMTLSFIAMAPQRRP